MEVGISNCLKRRIVPKDFFKIDFGKDDWQKIPVPSNCNSTLDDFPLYVLTLLIHMKLIQH